MLSALPRAGICFRIGAGFYTMTRKACAKPGVWLANSPDYGVGEVATHALALALDIIRGTRHTADIPRRQSGITNQTDAAALPR